MSDFTKQIFSCELAFNSQIQISVLNIGLTTYIPPTTTRKLVFTDQVYIWDVSLGWSYEMCYSIYHNFRYCILLFVLATKIESKINSIEELAGQDELLYGVLSSGTTYNFFRESTIPLYQTTRKLSARFARASTFLAPAESFLTTSDNLHRSTVTEAL